MEYKLSFIHEVKGFLLAFSATPTYYAEYITIRSFVLHFGDLPFFVVDLSERSSYSMFPIWTEFSLQMRSKYSQKVQYVSVLVALREKTI